MKVIALDCLAKLFTFSYLEEPVEFTINPRTGAVPPPHDPMVDAAVQTVCDCFNSDGTDPHVELQIVKALMAAVLNDELIVHGATLLKAIRQTYTIFVTTSSSSNQTIAQATLSQMINVIFERVKSQIKKPAATPVTPSTPSFDSGPFNSLQVADARKGSSASSILSTGDKLTLQQMESMGSNGENGDEEFDDSSENDLFVTDAFLVFRTLCKLSEKPLEYEGLDMRSPGVRSKLLSLHLIHTIFKYYMPIFNSQEIILSSQQKGDKTFLALVKDYICSSLARNAASISPAVFEISAEIFWLIVSNLRSQFKKEIQVFFAEIYFPITEMKTSTPHQKQYFLSIIKKLSNDPKALVEIYLNYDCDSTATINIYENIIDLLVRLAVSPISLTPIQQQYYSEQKNRPIAVYNLALPPSTAISNVVSHTSPEPLYPIEHALKMTALESLTTALRSLHSWSRRRLSAIAKSDISENNKASDSENALDESQNSLTPMLDDPDQFESLKIKKTALMDAVRKFNSKPKQGIKAFLEAGFIEDTKPNTIARLLLDTEGLNKSQIGEYLGEGDPENIVVMHAFVDMMDFTDLPFVAALRVFLQAFRLPGEAQKIDRFMLKFAERYISGNPTIFANADTAYVLAYSVILLNTDQHSSQIKTRMTIEDFIKNNRGINNNEDLPDDVLVEIFNDIQSNEIKLLSEQHAALLASTGTQSQGGFSGFANSFNAGRDSQRAYVQASREMSNKTEERFKSLISEDKKRPGGSTFYVASRVEHVRPMFEVAWMSLLAGLSGPFQRSDDPEIIKLCLEGFKYAIHIACLFEIDLARISLISALAQFTHLQNINELKAKNVGAIKQLLESALEDGDRLKTSWKDVLTCISQLERFQLISSGIAAGVIPDVTNARLASRPSTDSKTTRSSTTRGIRGGFGRKLSTQHNNGSSVSLNTGAKQSVDSVKLGEELQSSEVVILMDKIFTRSASLSGDGIVAFVRALTQVSWEEIQSSGLSEHPRTFSLQKMVDVSYYNMERIRFEWSQLWAIMGKSFNQVGCHENTIVVFFALDSLRQLSVRFFDLDELSFFMFQKDFLEPFEYVMSNNPNAQVKDMVLQCLRQMIMAKSDRIKSGWKTMFNTLSVAARQPYGVVVDQTFDLVKYIHTDYLEQVISQESFGSMINTLGAISKNGRFQKPALHAIDLLKDTISLIIPLTQQSAIPDETSPEKIATAVEELYAKFWFPVLSAFHDIIMNGEDLEVRSRALNYFFDALVEHGSKFSASFWDIVCRQLLFPIFVVLKSRSEMARFNTQDDMSVWLSTTMIQALRNMIALLTHYFGILSRMLDGFLELLVNCILQENETVSRIGSSCLSQLVEQNVNNLEPGHWTQIADRIEYLFEATTAHELLNGFEDGDEGSENGLFLHEEQNGNHEHLSPMTPPRNTRGFSKSPALSGASSSSVHLGANNSAILLKPGAPKTPTTPRSASRASWTDVSHERQRKFRKTIVQCVLQLLMIDVVQELLERPDVIEPTEAEAAAEAELPDLEEPKTHGSDIYHKIPAKDLVRLLGFLYNSYVFSRDFNENRELRTTLWRQGFMKQLPNLLKQETFSAHTYISVILRFYNDSAKLYTNGETLEVPFTVRESSPDTHGEYTVTLKTTADLKAHLERLAVPLCVEILTRYASLDAKTEARNIAAWTPVTQVILERVAQMANADFGRLVLTLYPAMLDVLDRDLTPPLRGALKKALKRVSDHMVKGKNRAYGAV